MVGADCSVCGRGAGIGAPGVAVVHAEANTIANTASAMRTVVLLSKVTSNGNTIIIS